MDYDCACLTFNRVTPETKLFNSLVVPSFLVVKLQKSQS